MTRANANALGATRSTFRSLQLRTVNSKLREQSSACVPLAILLAVQVRHGGFVLWRTGGSRYIDGLGFDRWPELGVAVDFLAMLSLPG